MHLRLFNSTISFCQFSIPSSSHGLLNYTAALFHLISVLLDSPTVSQRGIVSQFFRCCQLFGWCIAQFFSSRCTSRKTQQLETYRRTVSYLARDTSLTTASKSKVVKHVLLIKKTRVWHLIRRPLQVFFVGYPLASYMRYPLEARCNISGVTSSFSAMI